MNSFNHSEGNLTSEVPRERKEEIQNKEITEQENPNRGHKDEEEDWHLVEKI